MSWAFQPLLPGGANELATTGTNFTGYVKVWSGADWVIKPVKVWDGSQWVIKPAKYYNGATWVATNPV